MSEELGHPRVAMKKALFIPVCEVMVDEYEIETLEGTMKAKRGDYIATGVKGERYPIRRDIFEETYEWIKNDLDHECRFCEQPVHETEKLCEQCNRAYRAGVEDESMDKIFYLPGFGDTTKREIQERVHKHFEKIREQNKGKYWVCECQSEIDYVHHEISVTHCDKCGSDISKERIERAN